MPRWNAKLDDGRTVTLEADTQPTPEEVIQALGEYRGFIPGPEKATIKSPDEVGHVPTGEALTTYGGPRKPLASLAETMVEPGEALTNPRLTTPKFTINPDDAPALAVGKEAVNIASSIPEFFSSNLGLMSVAAGAAAPATVAGAFSLDMIKSAGEQIQSTYANWDRMTKAQKYAAMTDIGGTGLMALLTGRVAAKPALAKIAPLTAKAVEEVGPPVMGSVLKPPAERGVVVTLGTEDAELVGRPVVSSPLKHASEYKLEQQRKRAAMRQTTEQGPTPDIGVPNAESIRRSEGQLYPQGQVSQEGQGNRGPLVEQVPSEQPQPLGPRERAEVAKSTKPLEEEINSPSENPNGQQREKQNEIFSRRRTQVKSFIDGLPDGEYVVSLEGSPDMEVTIQTSKNGRRSVFSSKTGEAVDLEAELNWGRAVQPDGTVVFDHSTIRPKPKPPSSQPIPEPAPAPPVEVKAEGGKAKEAWEMTKAEFENGPPVKEGFVRLWRGEHGPPNAGSENYEGRWFSTSREVADFFASLNPSTSKARIVYVDVPKADLAKYDAYNFPDAQTGFRPSDEQAYILPTELAATKKHWVDYGEPHSEQVAKAIDEGKIQSHPDYPDLKPPGTEPPKPPPAETGKGSAEAVAKKWEGEGQGAAEPEPTWMDYPLSYWKANAVPQKLGKGQWRTKLAAALGVKDTPASVAKGLRGVIRDLEAQQKKIQRKAENEAADRFDQEQDALITKIEKGEPVSQADVDRLLQPDSEWAKRAKTQPTPPPPAAPVSENLLIHPRTDGMVTLKDSRGASLGSFRNADDAALWARQNGYGIAAGSPLKPTPPPPAGTEKVAPVAGLTEAESAKLATLTAKADANAKMSAKERADYAKLKAKAGTTAEAGKPEVQAGPEGGASGAISLPGAPLAPTAAPVPAMSPKSQRQIITDLAHGLNLPIRFGRLRTSRFGGYFLKVQNLIGSRKANDIPIVSHEVGHKLDAEFSLSSEPTLRSELMALGDPTLPGSRSSWTPSKTTAYRIEEGLAEFMRHWLTDPGHVRTVAPNTYAHFNRILDANKDFGDVLRQAQNDIAVWRSAEPQARLRSHISVGTNPNKTPYSLRQLTRDLVDDLHIARIAVDDAQKLSHTTLAPTKNFYLLARNLRGSYGMADTFIRNGVVDFNTKAVTMGTSLEDALKPVAGRIPDFRDWIVAKRAQELHSQGRATGLVDSDINHTVARFDSDPAFQQAFANIKAWNDAILQYAVDSGLVTADSAKAMRAMNQDYVPLHRVFEVGAGEAPSVETSGVGRGLNVGKPGSLKGLHGSPRDIVDPLETMIRNAYSIITASEKAAIHRAVAGLANMPGMGKWVEHVATPKHQVKVGVEKLRQQLEVAGADLSAVPDDLLLSFFQNSGTAPFGENIIKIIRDGNPEFYRLDRELFDTFHALDLEDSGTLVRILSSPAQLLRAGVTMAPDFALSNAIRDTFSASILSKYNAFPFEVTIRGVAAMIGNPKLVAEWAASGGKSAIEANYFDRAALQKFLSEKITKELTPAEQALVIAKSPLVALRWLTGLSEEATRIGEYQKAYNALTNGGMPEGDARRLAAFEARDRQDFAKGGAKTKIIRHSAAFWNAQLQANVRLYQAFKDRPVQTLMRGLAFITTAKMAEQALNWDDPDYWDRPQWERDLFFLIPIGKGKDAHTRFVRIPTPFEPGVIFGTLPGRMLQWAKQNRLDSMQGFSTTVLGQTVPNPIPQSLQMVFADFLSGKKGWDIWRGRPVVPESLADLPADMQWTEQTSLTARKLGKLLGYPPVKIDHIIQSTSGGLGRQVVHQGIDRAISLAGGGERTAHGTAIGGRFVSTPAAVASQSIEDFYSTLASLREEKERAKANKIAASPMWLSRFERTARDLSTLNRMIRQSKDEKTKQTHAERKLKLARQLMDQYRRQTK